MLCVIVSSPFRETGALSFDLFDFVDSVNSDLDLGTDCRYQLPSSLPGLGRLDFRIEGSPHPPVRNSTSAGSMLFLSYVSSRFIPPMISRVTSSGKPRRVGLALAHEALTAESSVRAPLLSDCTFIQLQSRGAATARRHAPTSSTGIKRLRRKSDLDLFESTTSRRHSPPLIESLRPVQDHRRSSRFVAQRRRRLIRGSMLLIHSVGFRDPMLPSRTYLSILGKKEPMLGFAAARLPELGRNGEGAYYLNGVRIERHPIAHGNILPSTTNGTHAASETTPLLQGATQPEHHLEYSLATTFVAAVGVIAFFVFKPASSSGESPPPHVHPPSPDGSGAGIPKHQWRRDAQIYGWASALLYLTSRIPQIMKNRKTYCEGLSMALFVFALLGNSTYVASIMLKSTDPEYHLLENASWLVGSLGVVFLDFIVLAQFVKYAPEREKLRLEVGCGGPGGGCAGSGPASRLILNKSKGLRSGRGLTPISSTDQLAVEGVILPLPNMKTSILPLTIAMLAVVARAAPVAPSHDIESHPSSVIPDDLQKRQIAKGSSVERVGTRKTDSLKRDGPPTPAEGASEAAVKTKRGMKTWIAAGTAGGVFLDRMVFQKIWPTLDLSSLPPYQAPPASDPSTLPSDKSKPASNQSTPPSNKSTPPYGQYAPPSPYPNKRSLSEEKDANIIRMKQEQLERLVANGVP
ncbi:unnamed protein product [Tilletia caries]|nr:unnamed protein product [Tilletia caries]